MLRRRAAAACALTALMAAGPAALTTDSAGAASGRPTFSAAQGRCGHAELNDVDDLRLRPLIARLTHVGVTSPHQAEPPHGRPFRTLYGSVNGRTLYATAVRPHSGLFGAGSSRLVSRYLVDDTLVAERVRCSRPHTRFYVFADDDVIWSFSGLPQPGVNALIRRFDRTNP